MEDKVEQKKKKKITLKQRKWIKEYIATGNATEAAMKVYDCKDKGTAANIGSENLRKLQMTELMEEMGLTDVTLLNVGTVGMTEANKIHGTGDSYVEVPDYATRHKYWETMLKLKRKLGSDTNVAVQVNVQPILGGESVIDVHTNDSNNEDTKVE